MEGGDRDEEKVGREGEGERGGRERRRRER